MSEGKVMLDTMAGSRPAASADIPKAFTHMDGSRVEVEIVGLPSPIGLVKIRLGDRYYIRARVQLDPSNAAAKRVLGA